MAKHGISTEQLASGIGYSPRSIHNLSCGNSKSRTARQKVADFFQESIWEGIEPAGRAVVFPAGVEVDFSGHDQAALEWLDELPDSVQLRGSKLVFTKPAVLVVARDQAQQIFGTKKLHMPDAHGASIRAATAK